MSIEDRSDRYNKALVRASEVLLQSVAAEARALHRRDEANANPTTSDHTRTTLAYGYRRAEHDRQEAVTALLRVHGDFLSG